MATVQSLSDDILHLVFHLALPSIITTSHPLDPLTTPPLNFSAVCRSWRTIVSSYPSLWSTFRIDPHAETKEPNSSSLALHPSVPYFVAKWFNNSKNAELNTYLALFRRSDDSILDELCSLILPQYQRCKKIEIRIHVNGRSLVQDPIRFRCSPSAMFVVAISSFSFQYAAALCLDLTDLTVGSASQPSLRDLYVSPGVDFLFPQPSNTLYLPNLRKLSFHTDPNGKLDDIFNVLSVCRNISTLYIVIEGKSRPTSFPSRNETQIIHLPQLAIFILITYAGTAANLLCRLACPSLRSFISTVEDVVTPQDLCSVTAFLSRWSSHPPLIVLKLTYNSIPGTSTSSDLYREHVEALRGLFRLLRNLRGVQLGDLVISNELIEELTVQPNSGESRSDVLCPSLSEICFECAGRFALRKETMEEMIVSRWKSGNTLSSVLLGLHELGNLLEESERLRACMEEGLEIKVYS